MKSPFICFLKEKKSLEYWSVLANLEKMTWKYFLFAFTERSCGGGVGRAKI